jgi:hypothetical protein
MTKFKNALKATWTFYGNKVVPILWFVMVPWLAIFGCMNIYKLGYEHTTQGIYVPIMQIATSHVGMIFCCGYLFLDRA